MGKMLQCSGDGKMYVWEGERGDNDNVGKFRHPRWPQDLPLLARWHMLPKSPTHRQFVKPVGPVVPGDES